MRSWYSFFCNRQLGLHLVRVLIFCFLCALPLSAHAQTWTLAWHEDFDGTTIDPATWTYDTGILNVNNEVEYYCQPGSNTVPCNAASPNAYLDGAGHLVIQAIQINSNVAPYSGSWTSARLKTQGLQSFTYGRVESSMSLPLGPGLWPAYWALGTDISTVGWPASGEIDFMENVPASSGLGPTVISSTLHGGVSSSNCYCGGNGLSKHYTFPSGDVTGFHTYGAIWSPNMVQFYVDDPANIFFVRTASDVPSGLTWDFNAPFFLLLNLAVGGTGSWPGPPDNTTPNPALMVVDYVHVYTASGVTAPTMAAPSISVTAGQMGSSTVTVNSASGSGRMYLSCSTTAPKAACSLNSSDALNPFTVDFSSAASATSTLSVTTTPNTSHAAVSLLPGLWTALGGSLLAAMVLLPFGRSGRRQQAAFGFGALLILALLMSCGGSGSTSTGGGGGPNGTPPGNYTVTVNAYTVSNTTGTPDTVLSVPFTVN